MKGSKNNLKLHVMNKKKSTNLFCVNSCIHIIFTNYIHNWD